jgi:molybdopterin synthase catalytic subunit
MRVKILLFALLKDLAHTNRFEVTFTDAPVTIAQVRQAVAQAHPQLEKQMQIAIAACNQEFANPTDLVKDGDEVAFFPPVSGGNLHKPLFTRITTDPVNHDELIRFVTTPATGAVVTFSGVVRGTTTRQEGTLQTDHLEYEAYHEMAEAKMKQVAQEIWERWESVQGVAIVQRIGKLEVGENTVVIACSTGHRGDGGFEAARYGIDRLKEIVPVWKKEVQGERSNWVIGDYTPTASDNHP